ncbi:MAG: hypothetical protein ACJ78Q_01860 [Chloroflexia bacterium]
MATEVTTQTPASERVDLLRRSLQVDGLLCVASGVALVIAAEPVARFMGVSAPVVMASGVVGLLYGLRIFQVLRRDRPISGIGRTAVALNAGTALFAAALAITGWPSLTPEGRWAMAALAEFGVLLGVVQYLGLRRAKQGGQL